MKRKHTLRSLLSMVCAIAMIVAMVPVLPAAAAADVFYDTMESYTVGTDLYTQAGDKYTKTSPAWGNTTFTSAAQGNVAVVADPVNSGNKVLAVTSAGQSKRYILTPAPKVTGDYTLQFDYMPATAVSNVGSGFLDVYINDGRNQIARLNYRTYGSYFYLDGASASPMAKNSDINKDNTWYSVRVVVSEDEYTMDIWEKGNPDTKISTTATKNQKANAGSNVEFCFGPYDSAWGMDTSKPITNYIDNIRITPGVVEASTSGPAAGGDDVAVSGGGMVTFADAAKIVNKEEVAITAGMGIFAGKEGNNFDPTGVLTRAEMATIIVKMLRGNAFNADNFKGYDKFSDTADYQGGWAEGYINACAQMGIVSGYGDGTFKPGNSVTTAEALTMIINALKVDAGEGSWPNTIMAKAEAMKLYGDLTTKPGTYDALTRDQLAVLVYEGMCYSPSGVTGYKVPGVEIVFAEIADAMKANGGVSGITEVIGDDALAASIYKLNVVEGYIKSNQSNTDNEYTVVRTVKNDGSFEDYQFNMETELEEIGHYVTVYYREVYKNAKEPGVVYNYVDETQVVTVDKAITNSKEYKETFGKSIKVAKRVADIDAAYNWKGTTAGLTGYAEGTTAKVGTYFVNDGEVVGYMPLVPVYAAKVRAVNKFDGNETIELSNVSFPISNSEGNDRVVEYSGIKKDDIVTYIKVNSGANETYVLTKVTTTKGIVEKTSTDENKNNVITIKGVDYVQFAGSNVNEYNGITEFQNNSTAQRTKAYTGNYTDTYTLYVTEDNKYVGFKKAEGGVDLNEIVFILGQLEVISDDGYGGNVRKTTARGIDMNGNEVNLLLKVEKNGTLDSNNNFFPTLNDDDNIFAPTYAPVSNNTFYTFELSNDLDAKKEGIYVLEALPSAYKNKEETPVYTGTHTVADGATHHGNSFVYAAENKYLFKTASTVYLVLSGDLNQTVPLTAEKSTSLASFANNSGSSITDYLILSRTDTNGLQLEVMVVKTDDSEAANATVVYVSDDKHTPAGTNSNGYYYDVYDYKTGSVKQVTLKDSSMTPGFVTLIPDGEIYKVKGRNPSSGAFRYDAGNDPKPDWLYTENILYDQRFVALDNDQLTTTDMTAARKASGTIVVDVRNEDDINAAGLGKITSVDRIANLAVDHPEITVIFDLCYSTGSDKMHTIFVKEVYFVGTEVTNFGGVWRLDGREVDIANVVITDKSGSLQTPVTNKVGVLTELMGITDDGNQSTPDGTIKVKYSLIGGKVTKMEVTSIMAANELFVERLESYAVGDQLGAGPNFSYLSSDYANGVATIVSDGSSNVMQMDTTGRMWIKSNDSFSGNYTFESAFKIGSDVTGTTSFRLRNIGVPVTADSTAASNWAAQGQYSDYEMRVAADGTFAVFANKHIPENNGDAYGRLYPNGTSGTALTIAENTWYKVKIVVDAVNNTVTTELYDAAGVKLGYRTDSKVVVLAGPVTIDMQGVGQRWFDDMVVTKGAAISSGTTYKVTVERTDANGNIVEKDGKTSVKDGETVTIVTTAKAGYKLNELLVNDVNVLANNDNLDSVIETVVTVTADTRITAKFVPISDYTLTKGAVESGNGSIEVTEDDYTEGETITITATPVDTNLQTLQAVYVKDAQTGAVLETLIPEAGSNSVTYTMKDANVVITAAFRAYVFYKVNTPAAVNGNVTASGINAGGVAGEWREGDTVTVNATGASGWECNTIYVNGEAIQGNTFTLNGESTITAVFWPVGAKFYEGFDSYAVGNYDIKADNASILPYTADGKFVKGTYTTEVANVSGANNALHVTVTDKSTADMSRAWLKTNKTFDGNYTVEVRFKHGSTLEKVVSLRLPGVNLPVGAGTANYELRMYSTYGGLFLNAPTAANVLPGFHANEVAGKANVLLYLSSDGTANGSVVTIARDTWYTVKVHVNADSKTVVTELLDDSGTTLGSRTMYDAIIAASAVTVDHQTDKKNDNTYREAYWDYIAVKDYEYEVPVFDVTVNNVTGGTVTADKTDDVGVGETVTLTATYDAQAYLLNGITVNGVAANKVNDTTYTFVMPREDVTVVPNFEKIVYSTVTASSISDSAWGTVSVTPAKAKYAEGEVVTIETAPAAGYRVKEINCSGATMVGNTITMPATETAITVTVEFELIPLSAVNADAASGITFTWDTQVNAGALTNVPDGETVTGTVAAQANKNLVAVTVAKTSDPSVSFDADLNGLDFSFEMPAYDVTVTATFAAVIVKLDENFDSIAAGELTLGASATFNKYTDRYNVVTNTMNAGAMSHKVTAEGTLELYVKPTKRVNAANDTKLWLVTNATTSGKYTVSMKVMLKDNYDYASILLDGNGYELEFRGGTATVGGTQVGSYAADTWYTVTIAVNGTNVTTTIDGVGSATTTCTNSAVKVAFGIAALPGSAANQNLTGYFYVDNVKVLEG